MLTIGDAITYLSENAASRFKYAEVYAAFGRIGSDEAEALEAPTREHAAYLAGLAQAVITLDTAARAVVTAESRHYKRKAMRHLADVLGVEMKRP